MSGKKGMKHYPEAFKEQVREEYVRGAPRKNPKTVLRIMRKYGLLSEVRRKRWQGCGQSIHRYANALNSNFKSEQPNKKWVTDISYIPTATKGFNILRTHTLP